MAGCDVVVIGAGMGGLTAAALLAKAGLAVQVLEADPRPGGYLVGFQRGGFSFDTAILWLNQCGPGGSVRRTLDFLGPGAPQTPPLRHIRRYRGERFDYLLTDQPDTLRDQLIADFPAERRGVTAFFAAARRVGRAFEEIKDYTRSRETWSAWDYLRFMGAASPGLQFLRYVGVKTEDGLGRFFQDPRLRALFCSEEDLASCLVPIGWAYHGDFQAPPAGGSSALPRFLAGRVVEHGSVVRLGCRVTEVLLQGRRAVGVRFQRRAGGMPEELRCRYVVAAGDLESLYEQALPPGTIAPKLLERLRAADLYPSSVTVWLGLDCPAQDLGFGEELVCLTNEGGVRASHNSGEPRTAAISVLAPTVRDPTLAPPGKGALTLEVSARLAYGDSWQTGEGLERGEAYRDFKQRYAEVLIDRVAERLCPSLREHVELVEVATPVTHWRYTANRAGSIMGATPSARNIRAGVAHYRTPVENLFLGGHWAEYGGGVPVAVRAGSNAALLVLMRERPEAFAALRDLMDGRVPAA